MSWFGTGYFADETSVPKSQRDALTRITQDLSDPTRRVFFHILATSPAFIKNDGYVPISARLIERVARHANIHELVKRGFVEMRPHSREWHLCREFRPCPAIIDLYLNTLPLDLAELAQMRRVNLVTGEALPLQRRSRLYDDNRNPYPPLVQFALRNLTTGLCNEGAVTVHLEALRTDYHDAVRAGDPLATQQARGRYLNDLRCYTGGVLGCNNELVDGVRRYSLVYRVQRTGRFGQYGGGLQSCSRRMKGAAYSALPEIRNYDLEASQARILQFLLSKYGIRCDFLTEYLDSPGAKYLYAERAGLSVDAWKQALYAVCFGAPVRSDAGIRAPLALTQIVERDVGPVAYADTYRQTYEVLSPLKAAIDLWHDAAFKRYNAERHSRGNPLPRNAVGMPIRLDHLNSSGAKKRLLAACEMQGLEAHFVLVLIKQGNEMGSFEVLSHEHDGLVVQGQITENMVDKARNETGLLNARLIQKPIM